MNPLPPKDVLNQKAPGGPEKEGMPGRPGAPGKPGAPEMAGKPGGPGVPEGMKRPGDFEGPGRRRHVAKKDRYDMDISSYRQEWKYSEALNCYYLEDVVYCERPLDQDLQCMNLYVPKEYMDPDGSVNTEGVCGSYTAAAAPVVVQSAVMGYSEVPPAVLSPDSRIPDQIIARQFLEAGMVYVSVGVRGRQTQDESGAYIGKAPGLVVDAKAAIRYYRHNKNLLPGNTERIVFVGVSAGGNLAALVGTTCDHEYFRTELERIGAAMEESDAVYASQAFCPITDLAHADMAYEWMFQGSDRIDLPPFLKDKSDRLTDFQKALSKELDNCYIKYVNQLDLVHPVTGEKLVLNADGRSGSFYEYLMQCLEQSASKYLKALGKEPIVPEYSAEEYLSGNYTVMKRGPQGAHPEPGLDKRSWLSWDGEQAHITSLDDMEKTYVKRMKGCPSFDSLELGEFENEEFGASDQRVSHFNVEMGTVLDRLKETYPEECEKYSADFAKIADDAIIREQVYALNPLNFIGKEPGGNLCQKFRIRVGSMDPHTSFTIALTLALRLQNAGVAVDFAYTWEKGHGLCDYDGELCEWIQSIC